jgi:hypothetical protein
LALAHADFSIFANVLRGIAPSPEARQRLERPDGAIVPRGEDVFWGSPAELSGKWPHRADNQLAESTSDIRLAAHSEGAAILSG